MGVDKGHCTEGIRTGSLSNSLLEKEQQVKRELQRWSRRGNKKTACVVNHQDTRQCKFSLYRTSFQKWPLFQVANYGRGNWKALLCYINTGLGNTSSTHLFHWKVYKMVHYGLQCSILTFTCGCASFWVSSYNWTQIEH